MSAETPIDDMARLREGLAAARSKYKGDNSEVDRRSAAEALHAVNVFLRSRTSAGDIDAESLVPLVSLLGALADVEEGHSRPMLEPSQKKAGRPKISQNYENLWATASAAITFLMEGDFTEEQAAREVARLLEKYHLPLPGAREGLPWKKLTGWRDKLNQGEPGGTAQDMQRSQVALFRQWADIGPGIALQIVFEGLGNKPLKPPI
jgi:hypothetical protein